ncbi:RNA polymerase sigma factor [Flavihumibacter solisilvae]|uniref:ECF subfamily RNA polymerase sigma-24 subunit n=1 Tax=Flavihumibacter solisilvae TaxID=1349421 RepID=A0A0C1L850_9BACT|nr:sigma-70 family RNA polymerase sigma factor [Flavihumibacter solisilvae]KIC95791.1 ECF subfamily RNA polymerase sigma-24 subunit [Flavihumibacter solisilvae]
MKAVEFYADEELIMAIREDRHLNNAISALYRQHAEKLSSFIMKYGASEEQAKDVFQDTVVAFIDTVRKGSYRPEAKIGTFLAAIAKNIWYNEVRKKERSDLRDKIFERGRDQVEEDASRHIQERELKQEMQKLLSKLDEPCRKILLLFYYENLSMKEIVSHLPYENEQVVRNKKYKCLQQFTGMVKKHPLLAGRIKTT